TLDPSRPTSFSSRYATKEIATLRWSARTTDRHTVRRRAFDCALRPGLPRDAAPSPPDRRPRACPHEPASRRRGRRSSSRPPLPKADHALAPHPLVRPPAPTPRTAFLLRFRPDSRG